MRRAFRAMAVLMGTSVVAVGALHAAGGVSGRAGSALAAPAWRVATPSAESPVAGRVEPATSTSPAAPRITPRNAAIDRDRWCAIVIHDSGTPAGDLASIERRHHQAGLAGLGYHFVIGNGQGMDDGAVAVGPRWERQLSGAHVPRGWRTPGRGAGVLDASILNRSAIAVCLVGRADRRPFTDRQCREVRALVRQLRAEFGIPHDAVFLACDLQGSGAETAGSWATLRACTEP